PAWIDLTDSDGDLFEEYSIIIDFNGNRAVLPYDISMSNKWTKDFKKTVYLGGSQEGDWNEAVERKGNYNYTLLADEDAETIRMLRELADYAGICHIRTPEGSSFSADIQVSENKAYIEWDVVKYTLAVTRIDPETLDGMTYDEWSGEEE
ncbi:MAG: hypothetical protein IJJ48_07650, partial [Firmicutes bacterium]|nr:hypothetical protein [Bacillota bacterium]